MVGIFSDKANKVVSRETAERLHLLEELVRKWNPAVNLVSRDSIPDISQRHIHDSVQLFDLVDPAAGRWCDFGSGGGFPGLVIAILAQSGNQNLTVTMVESDSRKAVFLREAARQLAVVVTVINARVEEIPPLSANVISARALAPLTKLCAYAAQHMNHDGCALFPKGANYQREVTAARVDWHFDLKIHGSKTDAAAAILELRNIQHVR